MTVHSKVAVKKTPLEAIKKIEKIAKELHRPGSVVAGLPKGSNAYPDGTSVIMVGAVHEFGSPKMKIPERSYLRSTVKSNRREYQQFFRKLSKSVLTGKTSRADMLKVLGLRLQSDIQKKITDLKAPALKRRDGNPLIDTGHLRQSIVYEIRD